MELSVSLDGAVSSLRVQGTRAEIAQVVSLLLGMDSGRATKGKGKGRECKGCGAPLAPHQPKYCSRQCYVRARKGEKETPAPFVVSETSG